MLDLWSCPCWSGLVLPIVGIPAPLEEFADQFAEVFEHPTQLEHFKEMGVC